MTTGKPPWSQFSNPVTVLYHLACQDSLPAYPESPSIELLTFLNICLQRDASLRPDITSLLLHPFVASLSSGGNNNQNYLQRPSTVSTTPFEGTWDDLSRDGNSTVSSNNYYSYSNSNGNNWRVGSVNANVGSKNSDRENIREHRSSSSFARPTRPKSRQVLVHPTDIDGERESLSSMPEELKPTSNSMRSSAVSDVHYMPASALENDGYDDDSVTPRVMTRPGVRHAIRNEQPTKRETPRQYLEEVSVTRDLINSDNQSVSLASESVLSRSGSASSMLSAAYQDQDNDPNPEQVKGTTNIDGSPSNSLEESYDGDASLSALPMGEVVYSELSIDGTMPLSSSSSAMRKSSKETLVSATRVSSSQLSPYEAAGRTNCDAIKLTDLESSSQTMSESILKLDLSRIGRPADTHTERSSRGRLPNDEGEKQHVTPRVTPRVNSSRSKTDDWEKDRERNYAISARRGVPTHEDVDLNPPVLQAHHSSSSGMVSTASLGPNALPQQSASNKCIAPFEFASPPTSTACEPHEDRADLPQLTSHGAATTDDGRNEGGNKHNSGWQSSGVIRDNESGELRRNRTVSDDVVFEDSAKVRGKRRQLNVMPKKAMLDLCEISDYSEDDNVIPAVQSRRLSRFVDGDHADDDIDEESVIVNNMASGHSRRRTRKESAHQRNRSRQQRPDRDTGSTRFPPPSTSSRTNSALNNAESVASSAGPTRPWASNFPTPFSRAEDNDAMPSIDRRLSESFSSSSILDGSSPMLVIQPLRQAQAGGATAGNKSNNMSVYTPTGPSGNAPRLMDPSGPYSRGVGSAVAQRPRISRGRPAQSSIPVELDLLEISGEPIDLAFAPVVGRASSSLGYNPSVAPTSQSRGSNSRASHRRGTADLSEDSVYRCALHPVAEHIGQERVVNCDSPHATFDEHVGAITKLLTPAKSNGLLVSASLDGTIRLWSSNSLESKAVLSSGPFVPSLKVEEQKSERRSGRAANDFGGNEVAASPFAPSVRFLSMWCDESADTIWGGGSDGGIRVWSGSEGRPLRLMRGHDDSIISLEGLEANNGVGVPGSISSYLVASGSSDRTVRVWDGRVRRAQLFLFRGHSDAVLSIRWGEGGRAVISASKDKTVRIWDTRTGR